MSWAFLHLAKNKNKNFDYSRILRQPLFKYSNDVLFITAGGNPKTSLFGSNNNPNTGFIVLGIGIKSDGDDVKFMDSESWSNELLNFNPSSIDGHFTVIHWNENKIDIFTDLLGLRDIYLFNTDDDIFLSTDPLVLKKYVNLEMDFSVFGSRWLLFNQISKKSIFKNIQRISAGRSLSINRETFKISFSENEFAPDSNSVISLEEFDFHLSRLITSSMEQTKHLSLSLSGGMDSRVLLAYLIKNELTDWSVHTFGSKNNPDRLVAEKIVNDFKLQADFFDTKLTATNSIVEELKKYTAYTLACNPASEIVQLLNYNFFNDKTDIIIDGGFGEIWRRQFLNRLFLFGKKAIKDNNPTEIIKYLTLPKADIFSNEINTAMSQGAITQLNDLIDTLPAHNEIGLENWLDLLAIKTRLPNIYSHEQTRLDQSLICFMPFAQLSLMKNLFSLDVKFRKNSKLFRKLIAKNQKNLSKYPLAKNNFTYSFKSSPFRKFIIGKIKQKIGNVYHDNSKTVFLNIISEFIFDTINSKSVKECPYFDYHKILKIGEQFRKNPDVYSKELDWFLSFHFLSTIIRNEN